MNREHAQRVVEHLEKQAQELRIGMWIKDNDPRMSYRHPHKIDKITDTHVYASIGILDKVRISRKRVFTDGEPRRTGWSVVP